MFRRFNANWKKRRVRIKTGKKRFSKLPKSLEGIKPVLLYPVIGIFLAAVVTTFINPYMGMINDALTAFLNGMGGTSRIVLGMLLGGMMSIDRAARSTRQPMYLARHSWQRATLR